MIGRTISLAVMATLLFVVFVVGPQPTVPGTVADGVETSNPTSAGCVLSVGRGSVGRLAGTALVSLAGAQGAIEPAPSIAIEEIVASGPGWALAEFAGSGGAGFAQSDGVSSVAAGCSPTTVEPMAISGISTSNGRLVELVVVNPYARDAVIEVTSMSEVGPDSAAELETIVAPAGAVTVRDLSRILPLRNHLSLVLTPRSGAFHAAVFETAEADRRVAEGVPGGDEWWVLLPPVEGVSSHLDILPTTPGESSFQIDLWSTGGLVEAAIDDVVADRSQYGLDVDRLAGVFAARVISTGPTGVGVSMEGVGLVAGGPAIPRLSTRWLLAGAGMLPGTTTMWFFNPGAEDVSLVATSLTSGSERRLTVAAGSLQGIQLGQGEVGFVAEASGEIAAAWTSLGVGMAYSAGIPLG